MPPFGANGRAVREQGHASPWVRWRASAAFALGVVSIWAPIAGTVLRADSARAAAVPTSARLWNKVTPAAGVPVRSAATFRAFAINSSGTSYSVDIYQIDTNGISTKLDTIASTAAGTYSAGTYSTHNMAAIYWQFASLPAASAAQPAVSVTFINDTPTIPLSSLYYNPLPQTPFVPTDPSLLLNVDLRTGAPAGWNNYGTGVFDPANGYSPGTGTANGIVNTSVGALSSADQMPTGAIAVRFQRDGVATDNSFAPYFWDSTGNTLNATTQNRQLLQMRANSGIWNIGLAVLAATIPYLQIALQTNSMSHPDYFTWQTVNSHYVPGFQDPNFADLVITWYQNQYYIIFDGHLVSAGTLGDIPTYQMLENICIGNYCASGKPSGAPFGAYYIQQVQISSRFLGPVMAGPLVGILGDSFVASYTQRATPTATGNGGNYQISDIDSVQNSLGLYSGLAALTVQPGQTAVFHEIQALMFQNYGFFPPIYNAGDPGHGFSQINLPIDDAYIAALNQAGPSIIVAEGSVNDASPFKPPDTNLLADTEAILNRLVLGGGSRIPAAPNPALEGIIYIEMLSSQGLPSAGGYPEPQYENESQNLIDITRTGMSHFAPPNSTGFTYITSREWWNEALNYAYYLFGTNPNDPLNSVGGADFLNVHPDPTGFSVIAAHLYAPIADAIMSTAGAGLSIAGTGDASAAGLATYSLIVSNAGPLASPGASVTGTLPSNVSILSSSSSPGCTQSGQSISCAVGAIAAGESYAFSIALQVPLSTPTSMTFALTGSVYSPNPNNTLSLVVSPPPVAVSPPPASGGGGGSLEIWALGALGAWLIRSVARKLKYVA